MPLFPVHSAQQARVILGCHLLSGEGEREGSCVLWARKPLCSGQEEGPTLIRSLLPTEGTSQRSLRTGGEAPSLAFGGRESQQTRAGQRLLPSSPCSTLGHPSAPCPPRAPASGLLSALGVREGAAWVRPCHLVVAPRCPTPRVSRAVGPKLGTKQPTSCQVSCRRFWACGSSLCGSAWSSVPILGGQGVTLQLEIPPVPLVVLFQCIWKWQEPRPPPRPPVPGTML